MYGYLSLGVLFIACCVYFLFSFHKLCVALATIIPWSLGCILDYKVDNVILKATIIGEILSSEKDLKGADPVLYAIQQSIRIVYDVLGTQGIDPKTYNVEALVKQCRFSLGMNVLQKEVK